MKEFLKLKNILELINSDAFNLDTVGSINNILLKYGTAKDVSPLVDYFVVRAKDSKNLKKDLKIILKKYDITEYDLAETVHILYNNIVLEKSEVGLYNNFNVSKEAITYLFLSNIFMYVRVMIFGFKFKFNSFDDTTCIQDIEKVYDFRNNDMAPYVRILAYILEGEDSKFLSRLKFIKNASCKFSYNTLHRQYTDSYLCKHYMDLLLDKDISKYYSDRMSTDYNCIFSALSENHSGEYSKYLTLEYIELLRKRDFLIPYNGLSIGMGSEDSSAFLLFNEVDGIEVSTMDAGLNLDIYERQYEGNNYLIIFDVTRKYYQVLIINLTNGLSYSTSNSMYEILNRISYMYGLDSKVDLVTFPLYGSLNTLASSIDTISFCKGTNPALSKYDVEAPYYWRYRGSKSKSIHVNGNRNIFKESTYIGAFKRKVTNGKPSKDAKELAKFYCLDIEDDETIVRPHNRHYL